MLGATVGIKGKDLPDCRTKGRKSVWKAHMAHNSVG
jgi:hypothetical protein